MQDAIEVERQQLHSLYPLQPPARGRQRRAHRRVLLDQDIDPTGAGLGVTEDFVRRNDDWTPSFRFIARRFG